MTETVVNLKSKDSLSSSIPLGAAVLELIPFLCHRLRGMYAPIADAMHVHYAFWQPTDPFVPEISAKVYVGMKRLISREMRVISWVTIAIYILPSCITYFTPDFGHHFKCMYTVQEKEEMLITASHKKEPCPHSHSRTNFFGDSAELIEAVRLSLEHVYSAPSAKIQPKPSNGTSVH